MNMKRNYNIRVSGSHITIIDNDTGDFMTADAFGEEGEQAIIALGQVCGLLVEKVETIRAIREGRVEVANG